MLLFFITFISFLVLNEKIEKLDRKIDFLEKQLKHQSQREKIDFELI